MSEDLLENDYHVNRQYKSNLFTKLFGENRENALSLYNAVNNSNYTNAEDLTFTTLEDVVYMKMKNDVSFVFGRTLNLYEHQSTYNPNMPLRGFLYFADLYRKHVNKRTRIYGKRLVKIPTPRYLVFYNGSTADYSEDRKELYLSDSFEETDKSGKYQWTATMININHGKNKELMSKCKVLEDYSGFVAKVREYNATMELADAIDKAVEEFIGKGVLGEYLRKHRNEVRDMFLTEFNEEEYLEMVREEEREEGIEIGMGRGRIAALFDVLSDLGEVSPEMRKQAENLDGDTLKVWTKLAARANSMEEFLEKIR